MPRCPCDADGEQPHPLHESGWRMCPAKMTHTSPSQIALPDRCRREATRMQQVQMCTNVQSR